MVHRLLQNRDEGFYGKFLEELKPDKFSKGDCICKKGNPVEYVYFIMNGAAINVETERFFESGQMINHDAIIEDKIIKQTFMAETDVSVMRYEASVFEQIIDQFPNFYKDLKKFVDDKKELEESYKFKKRAVTDVNIQKLIINQYNKIITTAKEEMLHQNQDKALRIGSISEREFFKVKPKKIK